MRTITGTNGCEKAARATGTLVGLVLAAATVVASAEDASSLGKVEATAYVTGRKIAYVRTSDGAKVSYDFRGDGVVYYATPNTRRNTAFSGTYTIEDDGAVCFRWNPDKYLNLTDGCVRFERADAKVKVVGRSGKVLGDVVE